MIATHSDSRHFETLPYLSGTAAHCKRVAAWCEELAIALRLRVDEKNALVEAALSHQQPELAFGDGFQRLMADMGVRTERDSTDPVGPSMLSQDILRSFQTGSAWGNKRALELAHLLEVADCLDGKLEFAPYESDNVRRILDSAEQESGPEQRTWSARMLRQTTKHDLLHVIPRLPVYPAVAMRLYRKLGEDDINLNILEQIAKTDQVIAGKLIQTANSVHYSPMHPIRTVGQAIGYIGTSDAARVLLAASVQPLFSSPRLRKLWRHALEAAQVCERLAVLSGMADPAEAFLTGLLHDIGKLAILLLPKTVTETLDRLSSRGCQISAAELVVCGFDHCDAGGEVLRYWKFANELVTAVEHHHEPERTDSKLASVLYLTEFWTDSDEDLPSNARLDHALSVTGLNTDSFEAVRPHLNAALTNL